MQPPAHPEGAALQLLPQDRELLAALDSAEAFRSAYGANVSDHLEIARGVVTQTLAFQERVGAVAPWVGYLVVARNGPTVVGSCGFKGNPDPDGAVELAYFTFPDREGQGLATAMARRLLEIAAREPAVRCILAHTLPRRNASTRILEKLGFRCLGTVVDPEDGEIWRWEREP